MNESRPCPRSGGTALKALIVGLCVLLVMTQAAAAANGQQTSARPNTGTSKSAKATSLTLAQKLALKMKAAQQVPQRDPLLRDSSLARPLVRQACARPRTGEAPSRKGREGDPLLPTAHPCSRRATPGSSLRARSAQGRDLRGVRPVLPSGARSRVVRVGSPDDGPERAVPRPVPDGHVRAPDLRPRRLGVRAGSCRLQVLRRVGPRLEPVELSLGRVLTDAIFVAKCGAGSRARVPFHVSFW